VALQFQQAQAGLTSALGRLIAIAENYLNLKADQNFRDLQSQLEGTENRIAVARSVGATVIDHVRPEMRIAQEEVFGPVLAILRVRDVDEAVALENASPFGNAAAVYTRSGALARTIARRASAGMIGVNVGVPVPVEPFGFGGWNDSRFGVGDITGKSSIEFWTQSKKTTTRW